MTKVILILTAALVIAVPSIASATCGTRGGPGYRNPETGKCESWDKFQADCGLDGSRCKGEQVNPLVRKLDKTPSHKLMECAHGMRNDC